MNDNFTRKQRKQVDEVANRMQFLTILMVIFIGFLILLVYGILSSRAEIEKHSYHAPTTLTGYHMHGNA